jgi:hypothetical protein
VRRRRDRARLSYGVDCPARFCANTVTVTVGPIGAENSGLKRMLQKGKALMVTTERDPADEVGLQTQTGVGSTSQNIAREDCSTHYGKGVPFKYCYVKDANRKLGQAPASSNRPCAS